MEVNTNTTNRMVMAAKEQNTIKSKLITIEVRFLRRIRKNNKERCEKNYNNHKIPYQY